MSCPCCSILGILLLVSLPVVLVQGLRPLEQGIEIEGLSRKRQPSIGKHQETPLYRDLKANNQDSTDTETLFPVFERKDPIDSEADFVAYCQEFFLFYEDDPSHAFISQGDLIDFIRNVCTVFDAEAIPDFDCPFPTFHTISKNVQYTFVKNLCKGQDMAVCLQSILSKGTEFGYHEDLTKSSLLEELCCDLVQFIGLVGFRKNSGCLQSPITVHIDFSSAPSPMASSQPNGRDASPTASPATLSPTMKSQPSHGSHPSLQPVLSNPTQPSRPIPTREPSTSFIPTITGQQVPSVQMEPTSNKPAMLSSPDFHPSPNPLTIYTPFPWNSLEPTYLRIPLQPSRTPPGSDAITNNQNSSNNAAIPRDNISVAAILGIVLGFGVLLLLGVVSSLKQARQRDFEIMVWSNPTHTESVH